MTLSGNVPYDLLFGKTDPGSGGAQPGKGYPNGRPKKPDSTPAFFFSGFFGIPKMSEKTPGSGAELQVFDSVICHFQPSLTSVISFIFFHIEFDTTMLSPMGYESEGNLAYLFFQGKMFFSVRIQ